MKDDIAGFLSTVAWDMARHEHTRATYWRRSALLTWAVNVGLGLLLWWRW